jgi:hypothetical protein
MKPRPLYIGIGLALVVGLLLFTVFSRKWWVNRVIGKWGGSNPYLKEQGPDFWKTFPLVGLAGLYYNGQESWEPPGAAPSTEGAFAGEL